MASGFADDASDLIWNALTEAAQAHAPGYGLGGTLSTAYEEGVRDAIALIREYFEE